MQTTFDGLGRVYQVSNPYAVPGSPSYWTSTGYDGLGRVVQVTDPDGSYSSSTYSGNVIAVTDEAGKKRQTTTDAAGRITQVVEDPAGLNLTTQYTYDALDDLAAVEQSSQSRSFAYDGLKRLICAQNPESSVPSTSCASLPASGCAVSLGPSLHPVEDHGRSPGVPRHSHAGGRSRFETCMELPLFDLRFLSQPPRSRATAMQAARNSSARAPSTMVRATAMPPSS